MRKRVDIEKVAAQVRERANCEDKKHSKSSFWKEQDIMNRLHSEVVQPWETLTKEDWKKAKEIYQKDIENPKPSLKIRIGAEEIPFSAVKKINQHLEPEYFYSTGILFENKSIFLLGKVEEHRKTKIDGKRINELTIGNELASNCPIIASALVYPKRGFIIGRTKCASINTWDKINALKQEFINPHGARLLLKGFSSLGLEKKDILKTEPEKLKRKVDRITRKTLETFLSHERGHILEKKYFPLEDYTSALDCARNRNDTSLERFVCALSDSLADTLDEDGVKGKYPYILNMSEPKTKGLFYLNIFDISMARLDELSANPLLRQLPKQEAELLLALPAYDETGDVGVLKDACNIICERSKLLAKKLCEAKSYEELKKIEKETNKELK